MKSYQELMSIEDYYDRFNYLQEGIRGRVGEDTYGQARRWLNQVFYTSGEWRSFRDRMIIRDDGCDIAHPDFPVVGKRLIILHHIVPITYDDILNRRIDLLMDPNNVVCVTRDTHNAIHYGDIDQLAHDPIVRRPGDTKLW